MVTIIFSPKLIIFYSLIYHTQSSYLLNEYFSSAKFKSSKQATILVVSLHVTQLLLDLVAELIGRLSVGLYDSEIDAQTGRSGLFVSLNCSRSALMSTAITTNTATTTVLHVYDLLIESQQPKMYHESNEWYIAIRKEMMSTTGHQESVWRPSALVESIESKGW